MAGLESHRPQIRDGALRPAALTFTWVWTALFFGPHQIGLALDALGLLVLLRFIINFLFWVEEPLNSLLFLPVWAGAGSRRSWSIRFMR